LGFIRHSVECGGEHVHGLEAVGAISGVGVSVGVGSKRQQGLQPGWRGQVASNGGGGGGSAANNT
jgi:hypothetical protein